MSYYELGKWFFEAHEEDFGDYIGTYVEDELKLYEEIFNRKLSSEDKDNLLSFIQGATFLAATQRAKVSVELGNQEVSLATCVIIAEKLFLNTDVEYNPKWAETIKNTAEQCGLSFNLDYMS